MAKTAQPGVAVLLRAPGNGLRRPVHLTSAKVRCVWRVRVDLSVPQVVSKRAGLVGVFPILGRRFCCDAAGFIREGATRAQNRSKTGSPLTSSAPGWI